ncbi:MAG: DsbA family protein [Candidatus Liptonbacteria bacterium]|nr:DsbA family protein [Candidatus Liptonbacteria bacterium]
MNKEKRDYLLPASILVAAILISGSIVYLVGSRSTGGVSDVGKEDSDQLATIKETSNLKTSDRDVILGDPKAPVTLIEFGDYQCPFCGRFFEQVEIPLRENYIKSGKVKMVFMNFSFLGPESTAAAEAAECAKDQKQFWAFHDAIYETEIKDGRENNGNLNRDLFLKLASELKLDNSSFTSCFDSKKYARQVEEDNNNARALGVNSTPTTFVNSQKLIGALPYAQFKAAIDSILK